MAGGADGIMQNDQSLGGESNSIQSQSHKAGGLSSGPPSAMRPGQAGAHGHVKRSYQNPLGGQHELPNQANSQVMDQKIDFYNKGMPGASHGSPGLRSAGGLGGLNPHADSVDAFQYQQDHYSGKHVQQRSGKEAMYGGRDQSSDDDNRYPAAEPIGKSHYGVQGRRQGGGMAGQYGNF